MLQIEPGYHTRKSPEEWHLLDRNGMQKWVNKTLRFTKKEAKQNDDICELFPHQHVIKDYMQPSSPYRSLLLYQGLGTGKTRASIAVAEVLSTNYKICVMVPASLEGNYLEEILRCGNEKFKRTGKWEFVPKSTTSKFKKSLTDAIALGISEKTVIKNKGVWVCNKSVDVNNNNFESLPSTSQMQIDSQVQDIIANRYMFVRYNGLQKMSHVKEILDKTDNFKNYLVIIDEVHNFISKVVNKSKIISYLYNTLLKSISCKLLLLSGTPLINRPIEMGKICNLARGRLYYIDIVFSQQSQFARRIDDVQAICNSHSQIDFFDTDLPAGSMTIVPLPESFQWADKTSHTIKKLESDSVHKKQPEEDNAAYTNLYKDLVTKFTDMGLKVNEKRSGIRTSLLFPDNEEDFDKLFIDYDACNQGRDPVTNPLMISRRLQGIVSYFEAYDASKFPVQHEMQVVEVEMPDNIYKKYMEIRQKEFVLEIKKPKSAKQVLTTANYYRCLSRAISNFDFPERVQRPRPGKSFAQQIGYVQNEMSIDEEEEQYAQAALDTIEDTTNLKGRDKKRDYEVKLRKTLKLLRDTQNLDKDSVLSQLSPKYMELWRKLQDIPGPHLLYSQFRSVEGLGIFKLVLEARGYAKLDIKKTATGEWTLDLKEDDVHKPKFVEFAVSSGKDKEKNRLLLYMFNSTFELLPSSLQAELKKHGINTNIHGEFVKLMMITQSGAEGISLRNVRAVHILEPYWNNVRIKQVIGRAVRAGSHMALPPDERNVHVFMYVMKFSKKQLQENAVKARENSMTSDQYIFDVARKKSLITDKLLGLLKGSAIDCLLYTHAHENVTCSKVPKNFGKPPGVLYSYKSINEDPVDKVVKKQTKEVVLHRRIGTIQNKKGEKYTYFIDTGEILDPSFIEKGIYRTIGIVDKVNHKVAMFM